jgi:hypothetical protein
MPRRPSDETASTPDEPTTESAGAASLITDGQPSPGVRVTRIDGMPRIRSASVGSVSFEFGDGDGPWTMPLSTWNVLRTAGDVAASFAAEVIS